jgi:hypothetical protein
MFESGAIHAPQHLQDLCVAYVPRDDGYIRGMLFPRKPVEHETDLIAQINTADTLRLYDLDISGRAEMAEVTFRTAADITYRCKAIAAKAEINPKDVKNADAAYRFEKRQTMQALISCGIRMEYLAVKQTVRQTSIMTQNVTLSGGLRWDAYGSPTSNPIGDMKAAIALVRIKTGTSAGAKSRTGEGLVKIFMHEYTWLALQQNQAVALYISASLAGSGQRILTKKILADVLDVGEEDIVIVSSRYTSSQQGAAADAFTSFIGSDVLVAMVDSDPENDQSLGHEFVFDGLGGEDPFLVTKWRQQGVGVYQYTDFVGVSCMADYKVTNALAGFLIKSAIDASDTSSYHGEVD